jgi:hypothetical protein
MSKFYLFPFSYWNLPSNDRGYAGHVQVLGRQIRHACRSNERRLLWSDAGSIVGDSSNHLSRLPGFALCLEVFLLLKSRPFCWTFPVPFASQLSICCRFNAHTVSTIFHPLRACLEPRHSSLPVSFSSFAVTRAIEGIGSASLPSCDPSILQRLRKHASSYAESITGEELRAP